LKNEAWEKIEKEFNSTGQTYTFRSADQLRTKYVNLKKSTKSKIAQDGRKRKITGGGEYSPPSLLSSNDNVILQIVDNKIMGLAESHFDDDAQDTRK
jgi:hypothetical protein